MVIRNATILLVEDDENDLLLMRKAFERARMLNPLQVVRNGEEAVAYLSGKGIYADREKYPMPILVLLDLKMPRMSGFEVLEWVRRNLQNPIVVVLTSSAESPDVKKAYSLGANSYLVKPAEFEQLTDMVRRIQGYWLLANQPAGEIP